MLPSMRVKITLVFRTVITIQTLDGLCCMFFAMSGQVRFVLKQLPTTREGTKVLRTTLMLNQVSFQLTIEIETFGTRAALEFLFPVGVFMSPQRNRVIEGSFTNTTVNNSMLITVVGS